MEEGTECGERFTKRGRAVTGSPRCTVQRAEGDGGAVIRREGDTLASTATISRTPTRSDATDAALLLLL